MEKEYDIVTRYVIKLVQTCAKVYIINEEFEHSQLVTIPVTHSIGNWRSDLTEILRFFYFNHIELPDEAI